MNSKALEKELYKDVRKVHLSEVLPQQPTGMSLGLK